VYILRIHLSKTFIEMNVMLYVSTTYLQKRKQEFRTEFPLAIYTKPVLQIIDCSSKNLDPISTCIHTYILWSHKCVIKTVRCGTNHIYTNTQIYSVKYYNTFYKNIINNFTHKKCLQDKSSGYYMKASLNSAVSFLRIF